MVSWLEDGTGAGEEGEGVSYVLAGSGGEGNAMNGAWR